MKKLLAALCMLFILAGCSERGGPVFNSTDITGLGYARNFSLKDHNGKPVTLESYRGKVVVMFFGFTQCPDVCPTTMSDMAAVMQQLGPKADEVQVLFVTVDPERDTPELLREYAPAFDKRFVGLWGTPADIAATAKEFKVFYQKVPGQTPETYTIDHTAGSYVFDKQGKPRLFLKHKQGTVQIAHDLKLLLS